MPAKLKKASKGASERALATPPAKGEWSATELIAHLRACADVWSKSIDRMLDEDEPTIRYVSPRGVMKKPEYWDEPFTSAFKTYTDGRKALVDTLRSLSAAQWKRGAAIKGRSRAHETVLDYARNIASHEAAHLEQFEALFR